MPCPQYIAEGVVASEQQRFCFRVTLEHRERAAEHTSRTGKLPGAFSNRPLLNVQTVAKKGLGGSVVALRVF